MTKTKNNNNKKQKSNKHKNTMVIKTVAGQVKL